VTGSAASGDTNDWISSVATGGGVSVGGVTGGDGSVVGVGGVTGIAVCAAESSDFLGLISSSCSDGAGGVAEVVFDCFVRRIGFIDGSGDELLSPLVGGVFSIGVMDTILFIMNLGKYPGS
jgi:hypothetical protein